MVKMAAKDLFHEVVKRALEKEQWLITQYGSLKKIVGWVERSETQQSHGSVGFRSSTQPT